MAVVRILILLCALAVTISAQSTNLLTNVENRQKQSLNGQWKIIIDPYETGYYNYRYQPHTDGYFENRKPKDKS
ncbi:MAG: beta-glucuronidase, partial [Ignavibacteriaceae bacterium]